MAPKGGIPDRWEKYTNCGTVIPGTSFIAFKVPLREGIFRNLRSYKEEWFTPRKLMQDVPLLGLVVDLTNTTRYYDPQMEFVERGITYEKIFCPGQRVPPAEVTARFFEIADEFLSDQTKKGKLLGVHCTHGLNRTGYLICKYMIDRLRIDPNVAIPNFNKARGHQMEREAYVQALCPGQVNCITVPAVTRPLGTVGLIGRDTVPVKQNVPTNFVQFNTSRGRARAIVPQPEDLKIRPSFLNPTRPSANGAREYSSRPDEYGSRTGGYGSRTDWYSSRSDQYSSRTDRYSTSTDRYSSRTDQYSRTDVGFSGSSSVAASSQSYRQHRSGSRTDREYTYGSSSASSYNSYEDKHSNYKTDPGRPGYREEYGSFGSGYTRDEPVVYRRGSEHGSRAATGQNRLQNTVYQRP